MEETRPIKIKQSWQWEVLFYSRYVIKRRLSYAKTRAAAVRWKHMEGRPRREIEKRTKEVIAEVNRAVSFLKHSAVPRRLLADVEFLPDGSLRQRRAVVLGVRLRNLIKKKRFAEARGLVDKYIALNFELWRWGVFERIFKFSRNNGVIGKRIVLLDPFELLYDRVEIEARLRQRPWRHWIQEAKFPKPIADYFRRVCDRALSVDNFRRVWRSSISGRTAVHNRSV